MRKGRRNNRIFAATLSFAMVLALMCGCGKQSASVPELVEPIAMVDDCKEVKYGDIQYLNVAAGTVIPEYVPTFAKLTTTISTITVKVGDKVKKGDVLAYAVDTGVAEQLESMRASLSALQTKRSNLVAISELEQKKQAIMLELYTTYNRVDDKNEYEKQARIENENSRFELAMIDNSIKKLTSDIQDIETSDSNQRFEAESDGTIVYVKGLDVSNVADSDEIIAVVANEDKRFIELPGIDLKEYEEGAEDNLTHKFLASAYGGAENRYALINGKKINIEPVEYTKEELALSKYKKIYPITRFELDEKDPDMHALEIGDQIPLYFETTIKENVLVVGKPFVGSDDTGRYVYRGSEEGKEKVYVRLGESDRNNYEILEGVEEGDQVYFQGNNMKPTYYKECEAVIADLSLKKDADYMRQTMSGGATFLAPAEGVLTERIVANGAVVEKDEELLTMDTHTAQSEITKRRNELSNLEKDHNKALAGYDQSERELKTKIYKVPSKAHAYTNKNLSTETDADEEDSIAGSSQYEELTYSEYEYELAKIAAEKKCDQLDIESITYLRNMENADYNVQHKEATKTLQELLDIDTTDMKLKSPDSGKVKFFYEVSSKKLEKNTQLGVVYKMPVDYISSTFVPMDGYMVNNMEYVEYPDSLYNKKVTFYEPLSWDGLIGFADNLDILDESKAYSGTVIGRETWSDYPFLVTKEGKPYLLHMADQSGYEYVIKMDTDISELISQPNKRMLVEYLAIDDVLTIPSECVFMETSAGGSTQRYYVWKIVDDTLVKTYVTIFPLYSRQQTWVIDGLEVGDKIALETTEEGQDLGTATLTDGDMIIDEFGNIHITD